MITFAIYTILQAVTNTNKNILRYNFVSLQHALVARCQEVKPLLNYPKKYDIFALMSVHTVAYKVFLSS